MLGAEEEARGVPADTRPRGCDWALPSPYVGSSPEHRLKVVCADVCGVRARMSVSVAVTVPGGLGGSADPGSPGRVLRRISSLSETGPFPRVPYVPTVPWAPGSAVRPFDGTEGQGRRADLGRG